MTYGFKVISFTDGVLILNIDGEMLTFPNAVNIGIKRAEFSPEDNSLIVESCFQINTAALPEYLQLRVEEIESQIEAAKK